MEFCLEDNHLSDDMSAASASAYSWTESDELVTVANAEDILAEEEGLKTAIEKEDEIVKKVVDQDLLTALINTEDLPTAQSHSYSQYSLPVSETAVDMDDVEPNSIKTAEMDVSMYTPPPTRNDVDMEQDVVGGASPMSTAITGSISWYSMPPSETNVEVPARMELHQEKLIEAVEYFKYEEQIATSEEVAPSMTQCQEYLEKLAINKSSESTELNKAFLESQDTKGGPHWSPFIHCL